MERERAKQVVAGRGWLAALPESIRNEVLSRLLLKAFAKGQTIYSFEDPPGGIYGLVSGSLAIVTSSGAASPHFIHTALPGFWFGEAAVVTGEPRRVGVAARTDVSLLHLPAAAWHEMAADDPSIWRHLALLAVLNLDLALRAFDDLKVSVPDVRVASILLRLAGYQTTLFVENEPRRLDINQAELAEMAGLSRNVVNRVLSRLSTDRMVVIGYGHIDLPAPGDLARYVLKNRG